MCGRRVLLIVSGGIAAYKALELVRLLTIAGCSVGTVLTENGARFVTPLSLQALTGERVHDTLWSLTDENEMGHIALSRSADLLVVCPASADILSRMAQGRADDLATTLLLATDAPVLVAPAMNVRMWEHPATRENLRLLRERGVSVVGPDRGIMACNEFGFGRLSEPPAVLRAIAEAVADRPVRSAVAADPASPAPLPADLRGRRALVTAGPTIEPIDPVRFLSNRSSGRQGYAIAAALAARGADVTLVSGPVSLPVPDGVRRVAVETGIAMLAACRAALPADVAVFAAAVADWRVPDPAPLKRKKRPGEPPPVLRLEPNPDILALLAAPGPSRPALVVGFAAETHAVLDHARAKRAAKHADWIVANDVSADAAGGGVMGGPDNQVHVIDAAGTEDWPRLDKAAVADRLAARIATALAAAPDPFPPPEAAP
ncbi:MAG: bifunctional phosphopantothenoylcysteine decarboxylase/phosphopantothenate--cysteine ligase CoaBC [Gluconacetobacter diazotrophicus]|nr:bifunctional phosphopantothenoylcysteine decarboxylase/phosphopantothenate--cysteine ligase CoaBC [Gluconacetobacter diazotrophicus]